MSTRTMPNDHKIGNKWRSGKTPTNSFKKGHTPWNKDLKGTHFSPATEYKKGRTSEKWMPVGTTTIRTDKNGAKRAFIKVGEPNVWKLRAVIVWESHNGPVPKGMVVHHRDHDSLNDDIMNLASVTRREHINIHRQDLRQSKTS